MQFTFDTELERDDGSKLKLKVTADHWVERSHFDTPEDCFDLEKAVDENGRDLVGTLSESEMERLWDLTTEAHVNECEEWSWSFSHQWEP